MKTTKDCIKTTGSVTHYRDSVPTTSISTSSKSELLCSFKLGNAIVLIDEGIDYISNIMTFGEKGLHLVSQLHFEKNNAGNELQNLCFSSYGVCMTGDQSGLKG